MPNRWLLFALLPRRSRRPVAWLLDAADLRRGRTRRVARRWWWRWRRRTLR
ncbi:MAG: hypothetical protein RMJ05_07950 [Thermomicrobium sp.]|nr:hypothetical protein [Thermomicrobium sp.]MDW8006640.1 hypothetical protein [Thermomicrobium sp.]